MKPYSISATGSSPLARGLLLLQQVEAVQAGIIPARAGFTPPRPARGTHPCGSSPLARGLLPGAVDQGLAGGIIPARAGFTTTPSSRTTTRRDHPRSRGVYPSPTLQTAEPAGSSPLARGLRPERAGQAAGDGIIPARAGFTRSPAPAATAPPDHPRSRGVYGGVNLQTIETDGSSPLARGLRRRRARPRWCRRIIPARAGFTARGRVPWRGDGDHPRSRGVYLHARVCTVYDGGSSPLARGLHGPAEGEGLAHRIIPARAGFTPPAASGWWAPRDHPRSRGVYRPGRSPCPRMIGSSPLARGLPTMARWREAVMVDHPRSRGVYERIQPWPDKKPGSSPLARGLPRPCKISSARPGIIPARAGFTITRWFPRGCRPDHPRSRGVYALLEDVQTRRGGSSPLARGLLRRILLIVRGRGIIPARAGFTSSSRPAPRRAPDHPRSRGVYSRRWCGAADRWGSSPLARGLHSA